MAESRDTAIKLFGKTIQMPIAAAEGGGDEEKDSSNTEAFPESTKDVATSTSPEAVKNESNPLTKEEKSESDPSSTEKNRRGEEQPNEESTNSQEKSHKKPDKITPCPRCSSTNTKFCYYNNYNVNQPRHFCKNCQRYWTAGGGMRNVPIGAGRRKSKNSAVNPLYCHITIPDSAQKDLSESIHHLNSLQHNGTVLSFGSGAPRCESMASALSLAGKSTTNCNTKGFRPFENGEEPSSASSVTVVNSNDDRNRAGTNSNASGFLPICTPWPYTWSLPQSFCVSGLPIPIHPVAAWGMPLLPQPLSSPKPSSVSCSAKLSPTLGKHSREGNLLNIYAYKPETCASKPKTLRFDHPEVVAKCSVWASLGLKNDTSDSFSRDGGLFKGIQYNRQLTTSLCEASRVLHVNPAALSRSFGFHENS